MSLAGLQDTKSTSKKSTVRDKFDTNLTHMQNLYTRTIKHHQDKPEKIWMEAHTTFKDEKNVSLRCQFSKLIYSFNLIPIKILPGFLKDENW